MPRGNLTTEERFRRLHEIRELVEEGLTDYEISEKTGIALASIKRNKKYLEDLAVADLTSKEISEKRGELYMELLEATLEAKKMFEKYRDAGKATFAKSFFSSWIEALDMRAKLYGLNNIKMDSFTQINTVNYQHEPDKIDYVAGEKLADMLKKSHERKLDGGDT